MQTFGERGKDGKQLFTCAALFLRLLHAARLNIYVKLSTKQRCRLHAPFAEVALFAETKGCTGIYDKIFQLRPIIVRGSIWRDKARPKQFRLMVAKVEMRKNALRL